MERLNVKILDYKNKGKWILGKVSLWDYLEHLNSDFFNYDIQRGIVNNPYLDSILDSIGKELVIPPFTLVAGSRSFSTNIELTEGTIASFDVLDGLQRTYRLWVYKEIVKEARQLSKPEPLALLQKLKKRSDINRQILTLNQVKYLFEKKNKVNIWTLEDVYKNYDIYIHLWIGLSEIDTIRQMLILNAGQKKVSTAHQYELMYLRYFKSLSPIDDINLVRFKARDAMKVARGERSVGDYLVTSIIIAMQSYIAGKPIRLDASAINLEDFADEDYITNSSLNYYFDKMFIEQFVKVVYGVDKHLSNNGQDYIKWFSKDTTISSIFGALGYCVRSHFSTDEQFVNEGLGYIENNYLELFSNENVFDLDGYENMYSSLSSSRINIGSVIRKTIFDYTKDLLEHTDPSWVKSMHKVLKKNA